MSVIDQVARPFVKWAGGKRSLLTVYDPLLPAEIVNYWEPMCGGAAVFWHLQPRITGRAILGDVNADLMDAYQVLRDQPERLIGKLQEHAKQHDDRYYYQVRALESQGMPAIERAARFMYLCRAGFNGLWRVNQKGQHNVPIGRNSAGAIYPGDKLFDFDNLRACSQALQGVELRRQSIFEAPRPVTDVFCYIDSPYAPMTDTSFTRYQKSDFGFTEQIKLAGIANDWHDAGALVMLSNSDTPIIRELYRKPIWHLTAIQCRQNISSNSAGRGIRDELIIRNYA